MSIVKEVKSIPMRFQALEEYLSRDINEDDLKNIPFIERVAKRAKYNLRKNLLRRLLIIKYLFTDREKFFELWTSSFKLFWLNVAALGMFLAQFLGHFGVRPNMGNLIGFLVASFLDVVLIYCFADRIDHIYKMCRPYLFSALIAQILLMWMESFNVFS